MPRRPLHPAARRRRAHAALALLAGGAAAAAPAAAGDLRVTGSVSQTFLADTNTQLELGDDSSLGSLTRLGLGLSSTTPTRTFQLSTGISYSAFTNQDNDNISGLFPSLNGSYSVRRPTQSLLVAFGLDVRPVDFLLNTGLQLDAPVDPGPTPPPPGEGEGEVEGEGEGEGEGDPGGGAGEPGGEGAGEGDGGGLTPVLVNRETLRVSARLGASYAYQVNTKESLSFSGNVSRTDFLDNDGSLTPSTNFDANAG